MRSSLSWRRRGRREPKVLSPLPACQGVAHDHFAHLSSPRHDKFTSCTLRAAKRCSVWLLQVALRDFPHTRTDCGVNVFTRTPHHLRCGQVSLCSVLTSLPTAALTCQKLRVSSSSSSDIYQCFCYVCEIPAKDCMRWGTGALPQDSLVVQSPAVQLTDSRTDPQANPPRITATPMGRSSGGSSSVSRPGLAPPRLRGINSGPASAPLPLRQARARRRSSSSSSRPLHSCQASCSKRRSSSSRCVPPLSHPPSTQRLLGLGPDPAPPPPPPSLRRSPGRHDSPSSRLHRPVTCTIARGGCRRARRTAPRLVMKIPTYRLGPKPCTATHLASRMESLLKLCVSLFQPRAATVLSRLRHAFVASCPAATPGPKQPAQLVRARNNSHSGARHWSIPWCLHAIRISPMPAAAAWMGGTQQP